MPLTYAHKRNLSWIGLAAAALLLLWLLGPVLMPFLIAGVLAYALHPAVEALVVRRLPRWLAVGVTEALALLASVALFLLIVPILARELPLMRERIPELLQSVAAWAVPFLKRLGLDLAADAEGLRTMLKEQLAANKDDLLGGTLNSLRIGGSWLLALVGNAILVPVVTFYLLMDWPRLVHQVQSLVPARARETVLGFLDECDDMLGQYLRGQLMVMGILAIYYALALWAFGFELAWPVGVFTGLAVFIPYLGFGLGLALAVLAAALQFGNLYGVLVVVGVYGVGQVVESIFLTPRLVGERIGLHPIVVIFALLAFGQLFGFVGVLAALPLSAVAAVALRRLLRSYRGSTLYLG